MNDAMTAQRQPGHACGSNDRRVPTSDAGAVAQLSADAETVPGDVGWTWHGEPVYPVPGSGHLTRTKEAPTNSGMSVIASTQRA
jgi:hypothetical protein